MRPAGTLLVFLVLLLAACGGDDAASEGATTASRDRCPGTGAPAGETTGGEMPTVAIEASGGGRVEVRVEIADSPMGRYIGLRGRESLGEDRGMLFVYTDEDERSYTMDDTLIPLSIAFMDSRRRIVDIQDMKPLTDGPYVSDEPAQYALEVNRGFFERCGVEVGDRVSLPG